MEKLPLKWAYFKFKSKMAMEYLASEISMGEVKGINALEEGCPETKASLCFLTNR